MGISRSSEMCRFGFAVWAAAGMWREDTSERKLQLQGRSGARAVKAVAWSADEARVVTGSARHTAVWDGTTGALMHELRAHSEHATSVSWSPDAGGDGGSGSHCCNL